jgi:hypothetical protein
MNLNYIKKLEISILKRRGDPNKKSAVCFITAHEDYRSQFKNSFQSLEEEDCFMKKPILLHDLLKSVKARLGLLYLDKSGKSQREIKNKTWNHSLCNNYEIDSIFIGV